MRFENMSVNNADANSKLSVNSFISVRSTANLGRRSSEGSGELAGLN